MDLQALFIELGLTPGEAKLYLAMREAPTARVADLARAAEMSRPRAYDVAAALVRRGVAIEHAGLYKRFEAVPLQLAITRLLREQHDRLRLLEERVDAALSASAVRAARHAP